MRFYAANNDYGTETSIGFSNTWAVLAFGTRQARDHYVAQSNSLAARAIKRKEVTRYINRTPAPFSGEHYALIMPIHEDIPGFLGTIEVAPHRDAPEVKEAL